GLPSDRGSIPLASTNMVVTLGHLWPGFLFCGKDGFGRGYQMPDSIELLGCLESNPSFVSPGTARFTLLLL
ncbi:MAG: hypothetical protein NUK65_08335, partial [Firmicutes bacterium]|nr:hypothetical protein [Bacillota bacterium]